MALQAVILIENLGNIINLPAALPYEHQHRSFLS
jgi:hypothetical protein